MERDTVVQLYYLDKQLFKKMAGINNNNNCTKNGYCIRNSMDCFHVYYSCSTLRCFLHWF